MLTIKTFVSAIIAIITGIIGLSLVFSDTGPSEPTIARVFISAVFFFLCGSVIGYFNPQAWIISVLVSWGACFFGLLLVIAAIRNYGAAAFSAQQPPYIESGLVISLLPFSLTVLGGYVGKLLNGRTFNSRSAKQ